MKSTSLAPHKISGSILDRFDICLETQAIGAEDLSILGQLNECSSTIRQLVIAAMRRQSVRSERYPSIHKSAQLTHELIGQFCQLGEHEKKFLQRSGDLVSSSLLNG